MIAAISVRFDQHRKSTGGQPIDDGTLKPPPNHLRCRSNVFRHHPSAGMLREKTNPKGA
jgi:hypothetical protein